MRRKKIHETEIIDNIKSISGFLLCDIQPTNDAEKFRRINWPPIFSRKEIQFSDLPSWMQDVSSKSTFPRKTLVQTMEEKKILLHTKLVDFYMENGFIITKIHKFIEYQGSKCFEKFYNALYNLRVEATIEKNEAKATAIKLTGNSPYGKVN